MSRTNAELTGQEYAAAIDLARREIRKLRKDDASVSTATAGLTAAR